MDTLSDEDEAVASDLDLHALIAAQNPPDLDIEPLQSAEEVIKEIDDLMQVRGVRWPARFSRLSSVTSSVRQSRFNSLCFQEPSSPEMSEDMHQSPDTPECAMPYRLTASIHHESPSSTKSRSIEQLFDIICVCRWQNSKRGASAS